jgi:hypothetical protein
MSGRSFGLLDSTPSFDCSSHTGSAPHPAVAQLLAEAHQLLAQAAEEQRALSHCLALLATAPPAACFFFSSTPPTLTAAVGRKAGSQTTPILIERLTQAQQLLLARVEAIRLQTVFALSHFGFPVALWHFVMPGSLPATVEALAPPPARAAA